MRALAILSPLAGLLVGFAVLSGVASGQTPVSAGRITGTVMNGTAGVASVAGVRVQLLALGEDGQVSSSEESAADGQFAFTPPADPTVTYVLRATYQGVSYLVDPPVLLSPELPNEERAITVYEATNEAPALRIATTVVSVQGLDRDLGELSLQREDQVVNPSDRVYVGGDDGVTLRIPAPDGVTGLGATDDLDASVELEGLVTTTTQALRPGANLVVTRYVVGYDQASDVYRLRVTSPLPASEMELWVPERFVDAVEAGPEGIRGADQTLRDERWIVVQRVDPADEGESLTASIIGLTRANSANPLLGFPGALFGASIALGAVVAGALLLWRARTSTSEVQ
ncbi:MAG: hypothetical protein AB7U23_14095 [Dehalococcoidia bacterium]